MAKHPLTFLCGTPVDKCSGTRSLTSFGIGRSRLIHSSPTTAFRCHFRWLQSQGYVRAGSRELIAPDGTVRVLTRPGKFGGLLRSGKEGTRYMPNEKEGGIILSL